MDIQNGNYTKFTSEERVNLTLSALSRDDLSEAKRLWETAPRRTYVAPDLNFSEHMTSLYMITSQFFQSCVRHYNGIQKAENYALSLVDDAQYEPLNEEFYALINGIKNSEIANLKALHQALLDFCKIAQLESKNVFTLIPINDCHMNIDPYLSSDIAMNNGYYEEMKKLFLMGWKF